MSSTRLTNRFTKVRLVALTILLLAPASSRAHMDPQYLVWADRPEAVSYTPNPAYSHHALGAQTSIDRLSLGHYRVNWRNGMIGLPFWRLSARQVTAYGSSSDYCSFGFIHFFEVRCFDASGAPTDSRFVASVLASHHPHDEPYAAAFVHEPTLASYTETDAYNPGGDDTAIVTRTAEGRYHVRFSGFSTVGSSSGNVQVTAESSHVHGLANRCVVENWAAETVNVRCFDPTGAAADSPFAVVFQQAEAGLDGVAFAWADDATSASYTPDPDYSFNPTGGAITATRSAVGTYTMTFDGIYGMGLGRGNVQVTAYGGQDHRCKIVSWAIDTANVKCFDSAGAPVDSRYSLVYRKPTRKLLLEWFAAAYVYGSIGASQEVSPYLSWNRHGDGYGPTAVNATHPATGVYSVEFTGMEKFGSNGGNAQVTAAGRDGERCKVASWTGSTVRVRCFDAAGLPADASFNVALFKLEDDNRQLAYLWADQPVSALYTPTPGFTHNPSGGPIQVVRLSTGQYRATLDGVSSYGGDEGVPIVTAYGTDSTHCKLLGWDGDDVDVLCVTPLGTPTDSRFSLLWLKPDANADGFALSYGDLPNSIWYEPLPDKSHNPSNEPIVASRNGPGEYRMEWPDFNGHGFDQAFALASAVGTGGASCATGVSDGDVAGTRCTDATGWGADSAYSVVVFTPIFLPEPSFAPPLFLGLSALLGWHRRRWRGTHSARRGPAGASRGRGHRIEAD